MCRISGALRNHPSHNLIWFCAILCYRKHRVQRAFSICLCNNRTRFAFKCNARTNPIVKLSSHSTRHVVRAPIVAKAHCAARWMATIELVGG
ncbi:hypothetical protein M3J09_001844 [Ascochyta lentis]